MARLIEKFSEVVKFIYGVFFKWDREWVVLTEDGFCVMKYARPYKVEVRWRDIREIHADMFDCYSFHAIGLLFINIENKGVGAYEHMEGWNELFKEVQKQFSNFNLNNYEAIYDCFPGDMQLPCWHIEKKIGNLNVNISEHKIIWEEDGSIYFEEEVEKPKAKKRFFAVVAFQKLIGRVNSFRFGGMDCLVSRIFSLLTFSSLEWVCIDESGFTLKKRSRFFLFSRPEERVDWENILAVFAGNRPRVYLHVICRDGSFVILERQTWRWMRLLKNMPDKLSGFNLHNVAVGCAVKQEVIPCWSDEKKLGDLVVDYDRQLVCWKEDGEVFSEL